MVIFLAEGNFAFGGSNETLGSPCNGYFFRSHVFFSSFTQRWTIIKKECAANAQIAICYLLGQSDLRHLTFAIPFG